MNRITRAVAVVSASAAMVVPLAVPAGAAEELPPGFGVLPAEFAGPLQVDSGPDGSVYVADAFKGQVVKISKSGVTSVVWSGQPGTFSPGIGVQGGTLFVTASTEPDAVNPYGRADLLRVAPNGKTTKVVDLLAYELAVNPDGQIPFDPQGEPYDALSNPYDVLALPGRTLIADAGGNSVLQVDAAGRISTFAALPVSREGECAALPNNTLDGFGCDPVPTGITMGSDGFIYVSGLGAEVEGQVWKLHPRTGALVATFSGLLPLTGIAAGPDGTLYVSALDFVNETGSVLRLDLTGKVTGEAPVPAPLGLHFANGLLYAGSFAGLVFTVEPGAFTP